jgi:hypothetical protein
MVPSVSISHAYSLWLKSWTLCNFPTFDCSMFKIQFKGSVKATISIHHPGERTMYIAPSTTTFSRGKTKNPPCPSPDLATHRLVSDIRAGLANANRVVAVTRARAKTHQYKTSHPVIQSLT